MGRFCLPVELQREGSAPAACTAGLFFFIEAHQSLLLTLKTKNNENGFRDKMASYYFLADPAKPGAALQTPLSFIN